MKKILIVFGTRPEAIKLAPLVKEFNKYPAQFNTTVCVTAQHREMLDQVLSIFKIVPDYDLNIMKSNQTLFDVTVNVLTRMDSILKEVKPDLVIVQGDTTTTFTTALAAYYNQIKVAHIEAGLRTYNKYSPFPEEINRKLTSSISDIHYPPTEKARQNLLSEGIAEENILVTGNTVIDALLWVKNKIKKENKTFQELKEIDFNKKIILVTGHRRENFGQDFINICNALKNIAMHNKDVEIVYPVHLNPNVQKPVYSLLKNIDNIKLIEPLNYEPFVFLMVNSYFIISDSGGIQEEAPSLDKPVLVTRNVTERPEAVRTGAVKLVGTSEKKIFKEAMLLLNDSEVYNRMAKAENPFGDGTACAQTVKSMDKYLF